MVEDDTVSETVAIMPSGIGVAFNPQSRHVAEPGALVHDMVLLSELTAGLIVMVAEE